MIRIAILIATAATIWAATIWAATSQPAARANAPQEEAKEKLQNKRITLLDKRVKSMAMLHDRDRVSQQPLIRCEMDLSVAKIKYAKKDEKRKLYPQLISKFDLLIEIAEMEAEMPTIVMARQKNGVFPEPQLLKLKSERVAALIEQLSIE